MNQYGKQLLKSGKASIVKKGNHYEEQDYKQELSEEVPAELEQIEEQIHALVGRSWETMWLIGKRLTAIREKHLHELGYPSIHEYAAHIFGFNYRSTYRFMYLAENFDRLTALSMGSKLYLLEKLDDQQRQEYLQWMKAESPSYRQIEAKIKAEKAAAFNHPSATTTGKSAIHVKPSIITINLAQLGINLQKEDMDKIQKEIEKLILQYKNPS